MGVFPSGHFYIGHIFLVKVFTMGKYSVAFFCGRLYHGCYFYNKTNNIVLRILCALHQNEAEKLSSMYHVFFLDTQIVLTLKGPFGCLCSVYLFLFCVYTAVMFSCCLFCSYLFLYVFIVYLSFVSLTFVLPHMA